MYEALTVREHLEFIMRAYKTEAAEEEVQALFKRFDLEDKQDKLGNELMFLQLIPITIAGIGAALGILFFTIEAAYLFMSLILAVCAAVFMEFAAFGFERMETVA